MTDMINLVVTVREERKEVQIPAELVENREMLLSNLTERGVVLPNNPTLTRAESGELVLHEEPSFG